PDDAAEQLAARGLRVHDAPRAEGRRVARDAHLAEVRVDANLREVRAEGVARVLLGLLAGLHLLRDFKPILPGPAKNPGVSLAYIGALFEKRATVLDGHLLFGLSVERGGRIGERHRQQLTSERLRRFLHRRADAGDG